MIRQNLFTMKVSDEERQQIAQIAAQERRSAADTIRLLVHREAERLGITPTNDKRQHDAAGVRSAG